MPSPANPVVTASPIVKTSSGKKLDLSKVEPADIVLTASPTSTSKGIRGATCADYSHAILVLRDGFCIESVPERGVSTPSLAYALNQSVRASLYRYRDMTPKLASTVIAVANMQIGKPYDYLGATRSGTATGCHPAIQYTKPGVWVTIVDEVAAWGQHEDSFFCSELVAYAFQKAGLRLFNPPYFEASPQAVAKSDRLTFIQELIVT